MSKPSPTLGATIRAYVDRVDSLTFLDTVAVDRVADAVGRRFVADVGALWWWSALASPGEVVSYGAEDGVRHVERLLEQRGGTVTLVATDDEPPPWIGVRGALAALIAMLRELPYFEYFATDESCSWVLFDTHENELILAGDP